jgi:hypothetical protein
VNSGNSLLGTESLPQGSSAMANGYADSAQVHNHLGDDSSLCGIEETSNVLTLTHEVLDAYRSRSACPWSNPHTSLRARVERSEHIVAGAQSLSVDLPANLIEHMAERFDGMMPLDRFLEEPGTRLEELNCGETVSHTIEQNDSTNASASA